MAELEQRAHNALANAEAHFGGQRAELVALLTRAHQQAERAMQSGAQRMPGELPWEFVHGLSVLGLLGGAQVLPKTPAEFPTITRTDGTLLGCRQWELMDPRWAEALVQWLEHLEWCTPFANTPALLDMPNDVVLGVVGDWGTGAFEPNAAATKVAQQVGKAHPDYTVHLGDVYYAGTGEEEENYMTAWPQGTRGSFTLNSNHEMYNGAQGYFKELARNFPLQNGTSYFSLQNDHWLVLGLDTAYHAQRSNLYMDGDLGPDQLAWLAGLPKGKRVLVFSHHEGYSALGKSKTALYQQVAGALGCDPNYWYWGHLHNGIVYQAMGGFHGRCVGHGAIPYGDAVELKDDPDVLWYETQRALDANYPERVLNGYAMLALNGNALSEQLMDENGRVRWASA
ncbi:MAG: metallophosphoesterase [Pseudomonadota bacterium]